MHWLPVVWFFSPFWSMSPTECQVQKESVCLSRFENKFFLQIARDWLSFISSQNEVNALWFSWFVFLGWQFPDRNSTLHPQKCYLFRYAYERTVLFKEAFSVDRWCDLFPTFFLQFIQRLLRKNLSQIFKVFDVLTEIVLFS